jgi:hypothetical protein
MWNVLVRWGAAGLQEKAAKILMGTKTTANPCHIWHRCSISGASIGRSLVRDDLAMKRNLDLGDKLVPTTVNTNSAWKGRNLREDCETVVYF